MLTKITRRNAIFGGAAAGMLALPKPAVSSPSLVRSHDSDAREVTLLPFESHSLSIEDVILVGIGNAGHGLLAGSGCYGQHWPGTRHLAVAAESRVAGAAKIAETLADKREMPRSGRLGRRLAIIAGDLADPEWLPMAASVAEVANRSGFVVVAVPAAAEEERLDHAASEMLRAGRAIALIADQFAAGTPSDMLDVEFRQLTLGLQLEPLRMATNIAGAAAVAARLGAAPGQRYLVSRYFESWERADRLDGIETHLKQCWTEELAAIAMAPVIATLGFYGLPPRETMSRLGRVLRKVLAPAKPLIAFEHADAHLSSGFAVELSMIALPT